MIFSFDNPAEFQRGFPTAGQAGMSTSFNPAMRCISRITRVP